MDDGRDGVEEREIAFARRLADRLGKRGRGEGAGRQDHGVPIGGRQTCDLASFDGDQRVLFQAPRHLLREEVAVDSQGSARRHLRLVGGGHHQGVAAAHLLMQQADRVALEVVGPE